MEETKVFLNDVDVDIEVPGQNSGAYPALGTCLVGMTILK